MILLLDKESQIGKSIYHQLGEQYSFHPFGYNDGDLNDTGFLRHLFEKHKPEILIHTLEYGDIIQSEYIRGDAYHQNSFIANKIALLCARFNVLYVYFSTSYIFNGEKQGPYIEDDVPHPINVYGDSKNLSEQLIRDSGCRYLIVRITDVYSKDYKILNQRFVKTINESQVEIVRGQVVTPTYVFDVVYALRELLNNNQEGIFHIAQSGTVTVNDFLQKALELYKQYTGYGYNLSIHEIEKSEFVTAFEVPLMNALSSDKYSGIVGKDIRSWQDALEDYFKNNIKEGVF